MLWQCLRHCVHMDVNLCCVQLWAVQYNTPAVLHLKLWNYFCKAAAIECHMYTYNLETELS